MSGFGSVICTLCPPSGGPLAVRLKPDTTYVWKTFQACRAGGPEGPHYIWSDFFNSLVKADTTRGSGGPNHGPLRTARMRARSILVPNFKLPLEKITIHATFGLTSVDDQYSDA